MLKQNKLAAIFGVMIIALSSLSAADSMKPNGCTGPVLCPMSPLDGREDCCHRWHVDLGLLYQQPTFAEMVAGTTYQPVAHIDTAGSNYADQTIVKLYECFDYAIGLTASLGHVMKHDNWYLGVRFDWLAAHKATTYDTVDQTNLHIMPNQYFETQVLNGSGMNGETESFSKVNYTAKMDIYVLDVLLSRGSYMSKCFAFEPYVGVKALWFDTKQSGTYYSATHLASGNAAIWTEKQDNWGAGPMFGFNAEFNLVQEIAIFSDSDVALLYGEAHETETSQLTGVAGSLVADTRTSTEKDFINCAFYLPVRSIIGVKFSRYCLEDKHHVALKIGYDVRVVVAYPEDHAGFSMGGLYTNLIWNF